MGRSKRNIVAVDAIYPDTLHSQSDKYLTNFISYEDNITESFKDNSLRNSWNEHTNPTMVKEILTAKARGKRNTFDYGNEFIGVEDVLNLSPKVKSTDDYIYRVRDWENCQWPKELYGTEREALEIIDKKIKNKFVKLLYNGNTQTVEYNPNTIRGIIASMADKTIPILITQVARDGNEHWYEIAIFKNSIRR